MANWIKLGQDIIEAGKPALDEAAGAAVKLVDEAYAHQAARRLTTTLQGNGFGGVSLSEIRPAFTGASRLFEGSGHRGGPAGTEVLRNRRELSPPVNLVPATEGIAEFNEKGFLAPGVYRTAYDAFFERYAFNEERTLLLKRAEPMLRELSASGIDRVYVGGSFITRKELPGDLDMLVHTPSPIPSYIEHTLNGLRGMRFGETQPPAKRLYGVDLMQGKAAHGLNCEHLKFFMGNREKESVGIVELLLQFK